MLYYMSMVCAADYFRTMKPIGIQIDMLRYSAAVLPHVPRAYVDQLCGEIAAEFVAVISAGEA